jgi:hypothetical protein
MGNVAPIPNQRDTAVPIKIKLMKLLGNFSFSRTFIIPPSDEVYEFFGSHLTPSLWLALHDTSKGTIDLAFDRAQILGMCHMNIPQ